jgi:hypothetical protein
VSTDLKRCTRCDTLQPRDAFYRNSASRDGRQTRCKPCFAASRMSDPEAGRARREREDPQRRRAYREVEKAVRAGRLIRPASCERCDTDRIAIQAHHADYSRPLDVTWLCASCHKTLHLEGERAA